MNYISYLRAQIFADVQNIKRDPMLKYLILLPPLLSLFLRGTLPIITNLSDNKGFDLRPYYTLIVSYLIVLMMPMLFGVIIGFMLLDERDEKTLLSIQVSPLGIEKYMLFRIFTPMILTFPILLVSIPITGVINIGIVPLIAASFVSALWAPILGLIIPLVANNKVEGFALMKGLGGLFIIPIIAFFVPAPWNYLFGIFPSYWPIKIFWLASDGESYLIFLLLGIIFTILPLLFVIKKLRSKIFD